MTNFSVVFLLVSAFFFSQLSIFSRVLRDSTPRFVGPSVGPMVRPSVRRSVRHTLLFLFFCGLWPHCSCPNDGVASNMAPAHPHATWVAVYPASINQSISLSLSLTLSRAVRNLYLSLDLILIGRWIHRRRVAERRDWLTRDRHHPL